MSSTAISKYHRSQPIRNFSPEQTLYDLVMHENHANMDSNYALFWVRNAPLPSSRTKLTD